MSVSLPPDPETRLSMSSLWPAYLSLTSDELLIGNDAKPKHRGFGFIEFQETADALDAVDNMHLNEINGRRLKVNLAQARSGKKLLGSNRAVWEDAAWLKEHAIDQSTADVRIWPSDPNTCS